jgi:hypothetical protein
MEEEEKKTSIWTLYEIGKEYNNMRGLYAEGRENYNFYHGRQWEGLIRPIKSGDPIVLNIVKPIIKYKTNIVNQNSYAIVFNPNTYETPEELEELNNVTKGLNQFTMRMWEKSQSGKKVKNIVRSAAINSEGIIHFFTDGEIINSEEIDKNNIYYGNESEQNIQEQPYILVTFRKPVEDVKNLARKYKEEGKNHISNSEIKQIAADKEIYEQQGQDKMIEEISPMCLVVMKFKRNDKGTINVSAATKTVNILDEQDTKSELYPFAHYLWEEEKGYARGISEVRGLKENQIEINRTATRRAISVKLSAYPKVVYDKDRVSNPAALDQVGSKIELTEVRADDVTKIVNYLRPATMSPDAYALQQDLINGTRELAGAGDNATGNVDPTQASGKAILAVQQASQMPINEQVDNYKYFLEDCAKVIFDIIKTEYVDGLTLYTQEEQVNNLGQTETFERPFKLTQDQLNKIDLNLKVDITPQSPYDVYAVVMSLENMLVKGLINLEEFTKALPEDSPEPKAELESILRQRREARNQVAAIQQQANALNSAITQEMINQGGMTDGMSNMSLSGNEGGITNGGQDQMAM